jgi:hypothetical protein
MKRTNLRRMVLRGTTGLLLATMATPNLWAWGREGHRLTALVAEQYLTPATKAQVVALLGKETLADVAPWADEYRSSHPETAPWHFVDIPRDQAKFDRMRDCPVSTTDPKSPWRDCVTDRIVYFEGRLGDDTLSQQDRAMALKFLVHLIGDVHQPFHALGDDRGGNGITVDFLGSSACGDYKCTLHGVWDDALIQETGLNEHKYLDLLLAEIKENHWERMDGGEPTTWANISHHYAGCLCAERGVVAARLCDGRDEDRECAAGAGRAATGAGVEPDPGGAGGCCCSCCCSCGSDAGGYAVKGVSPRRHRCALPLVEMTVCWAAELEQQQQRKGRPRGRPLWCVG